MIIGIRSGAWQEAPPGYHAVQTSHQLFASAAPEVCCGGTVMRGSSIKIADILSWADNHKAQKGQWPSAKSGTVVAGPDGLTWRIINNALRFGRRGLPGGSSLARLLTEERGVRDLVLRPRRKRQNAERRQQAVALRLQGLAYQ